MNFGELKTYARQRLGIENGQAVDDDTLATMLNFSLKSLDEVLATDYEDYHLTAYLAILSNTINEIPTPPDFFKLRGVDFGSPNQWVTLYGFGMQQRNYFNNPYANMFVGYGNQIARKVRVADRKIIVEPINLCAGQYQVWYTPKFMGLTNDGDDLPYDMDTESWIEYAIASTGEKVYAKLILPTESFVKQMAYYEDKVRNSAKNRMSNGPQVMQNVRNRGRGLTIRRGGWGF